MIRTNERGEYEILEGISAAVFRSILVGDEGQYRLGIAG